VQELVSEIDIGAPVDRVWEIVADFERYPEWNPYVVRIHGILEEGSEVAMDLAPPDRDPMVSRATVADVSPPRRMAFEWVSEDPDLLDGDSEYVIEPTRNGCRVTYRMRLSGQLAEGVTHRLEDRNDLGTEMMLAALKARAER
jgi:uncharacterized protein YndB with AHSA1/START domain